MSPRQKYSWSVWITIVTLSAGIVWRSSAIAKEVESNTEDIAEVEQRLRDLENMEEMIEDMHGVIVGGGL